MASHTSEKGRFLICLPLGGAKQVQPSAVSASPRPHAVVAFALAQDDQLWPRAYGGPIVLRVGFFEDPLFGEGQRSFVKALVNERWRSGIDGLIEFDWLKTPLQYNSDKIAELQSTADIRIAIIPNAGSASLVGVESIRKKEYAYTMQFGWDPESDEARPVHEFGHVLGLMHEQQSPFEGRIVFDREKFIDYLIEQNSTKENPWTRDMAAHQVEELSKQGHRGTPYDEKSVMHYQIPSYLIQGFEIKGELHTRENDPAVAEKLPESGDFPPIRQTMPSERDLSSIKNFMPAASELKQLSENGAQVRAIVYDDSKGGVFVFTDLLNKLDTSTGALVPVSSTDWKAATAAVLIPGSGQAFVAAAHLYTVTLENGTATESSNEDFTGTRFLLRNHVDESSDAYYAIGRNICRLSQGASVIVGDASIDWSATQAAAAIGGYAFLVNQGQLLKLELSSGAAVLLNSEPWVAGVKALVNYNSMLIAIADNVYLVNTRTGRYYLIRDDSKSGQALWSESNHNGARSAPER